jgi:hypothetical protein
MTVGDRSHENGRAQTAGGRSFSFVPMISLTDVEFVGRLCTSSLEDLLTAIHGPVEHSLKGTV